MITTIETDRLLLRPLMPADALPAFGWLGDARVMRWSVQGPDPTLERAATRIQSYIEHQEAHGFSRWLVLERATGTPIGDAGPLVLRDSGNIDLGFRVAPDYWGRGLGTEMASAWVQAMFNSFLIKILTAVSRPDNVASHAVLEKIGFRRKKREPMFGVDMIHFVLDEHDFARAYGK